MKTNSSTRLFLATLICLLSGLFMLRAQQTQIIGGREFILHTVKTKETVYAISRQYNVPQDTIYAYNTSALQGIKADEILKFPSGKNVQPVTTTETKITHTVQQGETLYGISKKYNVTQEDIIRLNPQANNGLKINDVLLIPVKPKEDTRQPVINNPITIQPEKINKPVLTFSGCDTIKNLRMEYNVALLLPFNTSRGINTKIAVEFYGGFRVAADSLTAKGYTINLFVYDTRSKSDSDQVNDILSKTELSKMDLIIGPLYTANLQPVADFGLRNRIPVISPFARSSAMLENNPYVVKINPSEEVVAEKTLGYFKSFYPDANIILIDPGAAIKKDSVTHLIYYTKLKELAGTDTNRFHFVKLKTGGAAGKLRKGVKNVIIFPGTKEITVKDWLTKFNKYGNDYDIALVGTEDWLDFTIIEADYYETLKLHVPTVDFFSYTDSANFDFIKKYQKLLKTDPTLYSYKGYQVGCYMLNAMFRYGSYTCDCLPHPVECECPSHFSFYRDTVTAGTENRMIRMMIFENYHYRFTPY